MDRVDGVVSRAVGRDGDWAEGGSRFVGVFGADMLPVSQPCGTEALQRSQ